MTIGSTAKFISNTPAFQNKLTRYNVTWMLAGPHSMKLASFRSLILCKLLCTCVGSTSPWIIFRIEIYLAFIDSFDRAWADTSYNLKFVRRSCQLKAYNSFVSIEGFFPSNTLFYALGPILLGQFADMDLTCKLGQDKIPLLYYHCRRANLGQRVTPHTIMFLDWSNRRMTSNTVVFRTVLATWPPSPSSVRGVYPACTHSSHEEW